MSPETALAVRRSNRQGKYKRCGISYYDPLLSDPDIEALISGPADPVDRS